MKKFVFGFLSAISSMQAVAHEGHGITNAGMHYFSWSHLLLPLCIGLFAAAFCYFVLKYRRLRK